MSKRTRSEDILKAANLLYDISCNRCSKARRIMTYILVDKDGRVYEYNKSLYDVIMYQKLAAKMITPKPEVVNINNDKLLNILINIIREFAGLRIPKISMNTEKLKLNYYDKIELHTLGFIVKDNELTITKKALIISFMMFGYFSDTICPFRS